MNKSAGFVSAPVETQTTTTTPEDGIARNVFRATCATDVALLEMAEILFAMVASNQQTFPT